MHDSEELLFLVNRDLSAIIHKRLCTTQIIFHWVLEISLNGQTHWGLYRHTCLSVHTSLLHPDCFVSVESPAGFHVAWLLDIPSIIDLSQLYIIAALSMLILHQKWNAFDKLNALLEIRDSDSDIYNIIFYCFSSFSLHKTQQKLLLLL